MYMYVRRLGGPDSKMSINNDSAYCASSSSGFFSPSPATGTPKFQVINICVKNLEALLRIGIPNVASCSSRHYTFPANRSNISACPLFTSSFEATLRGYWPEVWLVKTSK